MSTAALETHIAAVPAAIRPGPYRRPAGRGQHPAPRHLRLVRPTSDPAAEDVAQIAPALGVTGRRAAAWRITRRGRLALTCTATAVVALVLWSMVSLLGPAGATSSVVVEPGMTLSQIATEYLPEVPLSQAVTDLQRANKLSTTSIAVGQELVIPSR